MLSQINDYALQVHRLESGLKVRIIPVTYFQYHCWKDYGDVPDSPPPFI